ncbi:MAG: cobalt-precorrin-5B (C(1))-methyltransferase CbiD, partial [Deltaproteobacteria bacterium]|nr:cobalt-precorrin-5B (C(1))-methyltransferase CbiD [Deltaproteobacteria bacterium]
MELTKSSKLVPLILVQPTGKPLLPVLKTVPEYQTADDPNQKGESQVPEKLRWGFSTGTAATAAALGAVKFLEDGRPPDQVEPNLPGKRSLILNLSDAHLSDGRAQATIIKDGGDDPDVTNGARVGASVMRTTQCGLTIIGGPGVGRVTKPGLVLKIGEWAINPVPLRMLADNLAPFLRPDSGLLVSISIDDGEQIATKTLNPRLGIVGGLSVLGTTGLVKPFSHGAYVATIDSSMKVARALGSWEIVLTTGVRSEEFARRDRPDLIPEAFIQIADFFRTSLKLAVRHEFKKIGLGIFFGKA